MHNSEERARFESHVAFAAHRLRLARAVAEGNGWEGESDDLSQIEAELQRIMGDSLKGRRRPLRGQLALPGLNPERA